MHNPTSQPRNTSQLILLGADSPIGLGAIRELGRHGVIVHALGWGKRSIGLYSRYTATRHFREKEEDALVHQLDALGRRFECPWVMTVGEADILLLQRHREDFEYVVPIIPKAEPFAIVLDKGRTFEQARAVGIRTPKSWHIDSPAQLGALREELHYPLVLKWASPHRVIGRLNSAGLELEKYRYVYDFDELRDYLVSLDQVGEYPLVQEYCPGVGLGQMLFMHQGEAVQTFQHVRDAEWPPEGGASAVCRSLQPTQHADLMARSESLLQRLGWQGPAMVEYRLNPATGETCLMEVNGRFWGSLPLAYHAGASFAWLTYLAGTGGEPVAPPPYRAGLRCRYFIPELKRLIRILLFPDRIQNRDLRFHRGQEFTNFVASYFSPATRYYVFSWRDPQPFFADVWGILKDMMKGVAARF